MPSYVDHYFTHYPPWRIGRILMGIQFDWDLTGSPQKSHQEHFLSSSPSVVLKSQNYHAFPPVCFLVHEYGVWPIKKHAKPNSLPRGPHFCFPSKRLKEADYIFIQLATCGRDERRVLQVLNPHILLLPNPNIRPLRRKHTVTRLYIGST